MRGGGSPTDTKPTKPKNNTNLKTNTNQGNLFSSKDLTTKTNKSPKNIEPTLSKKNLTKPVESTKKTEVNSKKPYNLQLNEYISISKTSPKVLRNCIKF